ncbi:hypothetical protein QAD02_000005 [Eretmocerus hayati]|uniref:Uncharacterized protein n=1 Tax=Eretmocerus hayati TaxID=131215 RepID=A0ACC2NCV1_9HYME|nr:hypothetical protein QAD02_000005 [Eretmocerus hayati]
MEINANFLKNVTVQELDKETLVEILSKFPAVAVLQRFNIDELRGVTRKIRQEEFDESSIKRVTDGEARAKSKESEIPEASDSQLNINKAAIGESEHSSDSKYNSADSGDHSELVELDSSRQSNE